MTGSTMAGVRADAVPRASGPFADPPRLVGRQRTVHLLVLGVILLLGILKGGYWVVTTQVWSPVDEVQHYGYVESLARGHGIPTVGIDLLSDEAMYSVKSSPTSGYLVDPYQGNNDDPNWGATRHQYEAIHGPTYYTLMVPFYWAGQPWGVTGSLMAVRMGTVLVALAAVPITWAMARRLFPGRGAIWLLGPVLLVVWNGLNFGTVTNDALILPLAAASGLQALRALARPDRWVQAALAGLLVGVTMVTKTTSLVLFPLVGLLAVWWFVVSRPPIRQVLKLAAAFAAGGIAVAVPWFAWNFWSYRSPSASAVVSDLTGSLLPPGTLSVAGVQAHLLSARMTGLWQSQLLLDGDYRRFWEAVLPIVSLAGVVVAMVRRRFSEATAIAWCASALVLAFVSMEVLVFALFSGTGGPVGRHLYAALPFAAVAIGASLVEVFGRRWAPTVLAALVLLGLSYERDMTQNYLAAAYLGPALGGAEAPAASQLWADTAYPSGAVRGVSSCPMTAIGVHFFTTEPPSELVIRTSGGEQVAPQVGNVAGTIVYRLPVPQEGEFSVELNSPITASIEDRLADVSIEGVQGDPVIRLFCANPDAEDIVFDQQYDVQHPDFLGLGLLRAGADVFSWLGGVALAASVAWGLWDWSRSRAARGSATSGDRGAVAGSGAAEDVEEPASGDRRGGPA